MRIARSEEGEKRDGKELASRWGKGDNVKGKLGRELKKKAKCWLVFNMP